MNRYHPGVPTIRSLVVLSAIALTSLVPTLLAVPAYAQTPSGTVYAFFDLGPGSILGNSSSARALGYSDGVAVGYGEGSDTAKSDVAFRWNENGTETNLQSVANLGSNATSYAQGISGGVTVGWGSGSNTEYREHALRWNADGTVTNLNAAANLGGQSGTLALAISDSVIVGFGYGDNTGRSNNALRWNADGTVTNLHNRIANSGINLGPSADSVARGTSGGVTVGGFTNPDGIENHGTYALRWNADGTVTNLHSQLAASGIDLGSDPISVANGVSGNVAVGSGYDGNRGNSAIALRWNADGTVANLHATANLGTDSASYAFGIAGGVTVGYGHGSNTGNDVALRWNADGTALNLHRFVANGATISGANAIDASTGIIAGYAGGSAALWSPLNAGIGGANSLVVRNGVTTTINQDFTQNSGITTVNGTLGLLGNTLTIAGGTLNGAGTIAGNVIMNGSGILAPGNSPGTLTLSSGNFTMSGGTYSVDLNGLSFDVLNVAAGSATFTGGALALNYLDGYTPTVGDAFDIVTSSGGVTGLNTVTVPSGWTFSANGNAGRLSFAGASVVPEANTGLLVLLAGGLALDSVLLRYKASVNV